MEETLSWEIPRVILFRVSPSVNVNFGGLSLNLQKRVSIFGSFSLFVFLLPGFLPFLVPTITICTKCLIGTSSFLMLSLFSLI